MSGVYENVVQIGELQARVTQLEGYVDSLWESHHRLQATAIAIQQRELERSGQVIEEPLVPRTLVEIQRERAAVESWFHAVYRALDTNEHQYCRSILSTLRDDLRRWLNEDGSVPGRSHEDSGLRCVVGHGGADTEGSPEPCIKCKHCGEWIRSDNMGQECKGHDVPV